MTAEAPERIPLPDGTFIDGPLYGPQMPRFYVEPDRHREPAEGCSLCQLEDHDTGCGEYQALEALEWASAFGFAMDPWQIWVLRNMMAVKPNGKWAAPDCLLVISRQNGKNKLMEVRELAGLFVIGEELIIHTAHRYNTSQNHFRQLRATVNSYPSLRKRIKRMPVGNTENAIELFPRPFVSFGAGSKEVIKSVSPMLVLHARQGASSGRGFSCDQLVYDEAMILPEEQAGASIPTMSARANPQIITMGSAGLADSFYMGRKRKKMLAKADGMFGAEWSINAHTEDCPRDTVKGRKSNYYIVCRKHDDRDDPRNWAKANPAFGYRLSYEFTKNMEWDALSESEFDRERLAVGQWPADEEAWNVISQEKWKSLTNEKPGFPTRPVVFAADVDEDGASATISAAWAIGADIRNPVVLEIPRDCSRNDSDWVLKELDRLYRKHRPIAVAVPKSGPGAALVEDGKKMWGERLVPMGPGEEAAAFAWFIQRVKAGGICHFGEELAPTLWHAMGKADTRDVGDGGKAWARKDSESDITPVTSATNAAYILNRDYRNVDLMRTIA